MKLLYVKFCIPLKSLENVAANEVCLWCMSMCVIYYWIIIYTVKEEKNAIIIVGEIVLFCPFCLHMKNINKYLSH